MDDLRVLCLHGYAGNAQLLQRQMAPVVSAFGAAEFVYPDAPSLAAGDYGWWHTPSQGWERTRAWLLDLFAAQFRFDAVFGLSQGAALTGLLVGMRENGEPGIDFDFAVMVGGFKNDAPAHADYYRRRFTLPSVHIIGRSDGVIPPYESQQLADQFDAPVVLHHPGGHVIPADSAVVAALAYFVDSCRRSASSR